jgi:hypothetical protein
MDALAGTIETAAWLGTSLESGKALELLQAQRLQSTSTTTSPPMSLSLPAVEWIGGASAEGRDLADRALLAISRLPSSVILAVMVLGTCGLSAVAARYRAANPGEIPDAPLMPDGTDGPFLAMYWASAVLISTVVLVTYWYLFGLAAVPWAPILGTLLSTIGVTLSVSIEAAFRRMDKPPFLDREAQPGTSLRRAIFLHGTMGCAMAIAVLAAAGAFAAGARGAKAWPPEPPPAGPGIELNDKLDQIDAMTKGLADAAAAATGEGKNTEKVAGADKKPETEKGGAENKKPGFLSKAQGLFSKGTTDKVAAAAKGAAKTIGKKR